MHKRTALFIVSCLLIALVINFGILNTRETIPMSNQQFYSELISINGIGPVLANRIIEYRIQNPNSTDFINVKGIGEKRAQLLKKKFKDGGP